MTTLDPFGQSVPYIGIDSDGKPVRTHPEFIRYWQQQLDQRLGGQSAPSITDLSNDIAGNTSDITGLDTSIATLKADTGYEEQIPGDPTAAADSAAAVNAAVSPSGTLTTLGDIRWRFKLGGTYSFQELIDSHPSVSAKMDARGGIVIQPSGGLPGVTANIIGTGYGSGAPAALFRIIRDTPTSGSSPLAWSPTFSGFNIDASAVTFTNQVHGFRIPNPNPANNPNDPDPEYVGNKNYVASRWESMDIVGMSGSAVLIEGGNGRADFHSCRALNNDLNGFDLGGNDVVMSGHWAVGGNGGTGLKVGNAAGFFATSGNLWSQANNRSLTVQAAWFNGRKMFGLGFSEFNDWLRLDGNNSYYRGGTISCNVFAPFGDCFVSDGVAIDNTPGGDSRLQANVGTVEYQSLAFWGNIHTRTDNVSFKTWGNADGDTTGKFGTAPQYLHDVGGGGAQPAMVTIDEPYCTAPNVMPWNGNQGSFTAAGDTFTSTAHGLRVGYRLSFGPASTVPAETPAATSFYVVAVPTANTFKVAATWGGSVITTTGGSGTWWNKSASPYNVHNGACLTYRYSDSFRGLWRFGAQGAKHSHIALGINEADDINPLYQVEAGDKSIVAGNAYRNVLWGFWELDNAEQYTPDAITSGALNNGDNKGVHQGIRALRLNVAGGSIAAATFTFDASLNASQFVDIFVSGGSIGAVSYALNGTGSFGGLTPMAVTIGAFWQKWFYDVEAGTGGTWYLIAQKAADDQWIAVADAANISLPVTAGNNFAITLGGNHLIQNPTNPLDGQLVTIRLTQDGTGHRVPNWGTHFKFPSATPPTFSVGAGAVDIVKFIWDATLNVGYFDGVQLDLR